MKKLTLILISLYLMMGAQRSLAADPIAYLRTTDGKTYYVAVTVGSWRLTSADVKEASALLKKLSAGADPLSRYINSQLDQSTLQLIQQYAPALPPQAKLQKALAANLNRIIADPSFYDPNRFAGLALRAETRALLESGPQGEVRSFLNRMLLDDAYVSEIKQNSSLPPLWQGPGGIQPANLLKRVVASMYYKGRLVPITIGPPDMKGSDFTISFSDQTIIKEGLSALVIAVHEYPISEDKTSGFSAGVTTEITSVLVQNFGNCFEGFPVEVALDPTITEQNYGTQRLVDLQNYIRDQKNNPTVQVQSQTWEKPEKWELRPKFETFGDRQRFVPCYLLAKDPPVGTFDIRFEYPADPPIELRHPFFKGGVVNAGHALTPGSLDTGNVGTRAVEQNLDIGGQFSSSVVDKTEKNASGVNVLIRRRENKGTLDLRLAPLLNMLRLPEPGSTTFKFLTPFLIDARISTGKIDKDTLSLNRIAMGPQFEIRQYTNPGTYPSYQRYIFTLTNASDRDFKQAEWKGTFEFQPVFSAFNRPLRFRSKNLDPKLDPDPNHAQYDVPLRIGFGQQFLPLLGVEVGKRYRNQHPFAAIEQTNFVRRFYFGGTINLDLTSYVQVSVKDILYVRGEAPQDRLHNYFLGSVSVPFPSFNPSSSSTAFFSFERGGQPPFAKADVNTVKFGYRVQWSNWFGKRR